MDLLSRIYHHYHDLQKRLPDSAQEHLFLTGGAAAFLYGSDRPFSEDLDFMFPEKFQKEVEVAGFQFKANLKKPIFHSLLTSFKMEDVDCSIILKSVVQPPEAKESFTFLLTPALQSRQVKILYGKDFIRVVPPEFLFLIKLLAGRGEELGKYDLYDARLIAEKTASFDWDFFKKLIQEFCRPLQVSVPILKGHAKGLGLEPLNFALKPF